MFLKGMQKSAYQGVHFLTKFLKAWKFTKTEVFHIYFLKILLKM